MIRIVNNDKSLVFYSIAVDNILVTRQEAEEWVINRLPLYNKHCKTFDDAVNDKLIAPMSLADIVSHCHEFGEALNASDTLIKFLEKNGIVQETEYAYVGCPARNAHELTLCCRYDAVKKRVDDYNAKHDDRMSFARVFVTIPVYTPFRLTYDWQGHKAPVKYSCYEMGR